MMVAVEVGAGNVGGRSSEETRRRWLRSKDVRSTMSDAAARWRGGRWLRQKDVRATMVEATASGNKNKDEIMALARMRGAILGKRTGTSSAVKSKRTRMRAWR